MRKRRWILIFLLTILSIIFYFCLKNGRSNSVPQTIIIHSYMRSGSTYLSYKVLSFFSKKSESHLPFYLHEPTNPFYDKPYYKISFNNHHLGPPPEDSFNSLAAINEANILASIALGRRWTHIDDKTTTYEWTSPFTIDIFEALRDCKFVRLDALKWIQHAVNPKYYMLRRSRKVIEYLNCYPLSESSQSHINPKYQLYTRANVSFKVMKQVNECVAQRLGKLNAENITDICKSSPIKVLKFVRGKLNDYINMAHQVFVVGSNLSFSDLNKRLYPFKVIHLVRDPRAIIYSRIKLHWETIEPLKLMAHKLCKLMADDYSENYLSASRFDSNFEAFDQKKRNTLRLTPLMLIKYEDLMFYPSAVSKKIAKFLNVKRRNYQGIFQNLYDDLIIPESELDYTQSDGRQEDEFEPYRSNPLSHVNEWQEGLSSAQKSVINSECHRVLQLYRYNH